jgi:hypothetical protein
MMLWFAGLIELLCGLWATYSRACPPARPRLRFDPKRGLLPATACARSQGGTTHRVLVPLPPLPTPFARC